MGDIMIRPSAYEEEGFLVLGLNSMKWYDFWSVGRFEEAIVNQAEDEGYSVKYRGRKEGAIFNAFICKQGEKTPILTVNHYPPNTEILPSIGGLKEAFELISKTAINMGCSIFVREDVPEKQKLEQILCSHVS
jgi:hypothetical protein